MTCPFYKGKVGSYDWKGIKCGSDKYKMRLGDFMQGKWSKEYRDDRVETLCKGNYKECV